MRDRSWFWPRTAGKTSVFAFAIIVLNALAFAGAAGSTSGDVWKRLHRPLHIPRIGSGLPCPVSMHPRAGVAYPLLSGTVTFRYPAQRGSAAYGSPWSGVAVSWKVRPGYRGPLLIRGRQLDGPNLLRFEVGQIPSTARWVPAGKNAAARIVRSSTRIPAPGCYAYQVDGLGFSRVIVFVAKLEGPATADEALDALKARGLPMKPMGPFRSMGFDSLVHITGQRFENHDGEIVLWQFPTFRAVHNLLIQEQGRSVVVHTRPSGILGASIFCVTDPAAPGVCHSYDVPPPHWYRNGTALALYLGTDPAMLETMEILLGEQFAGVPLARVDA